MRFQVIINEEEIRALDRVIVSALEREERERLGELGEIDVHILIKFIGGLRFQLDEARKNIEKWGE